jgi:hypothetical protein
VDRSVAERDRQRVVDEAVGGDEREALEAPVDDGDVEMVTTARAVDDRYLTRIRKGRAEELFEPFAHPIRRYHREGPLRSGPMSRLRLGVIVALLLGALLAAPTAEARFSGMKARSWTDRIADLGPRPAGGRHEFQAGTLVRNRLAALGYSVRRQWFGLPNGDRSHNVVGRTPGRLRLIVVAHMDGVHGTPAANDNASGVGSILELARNLKRRNGVLVAALGAEERMVTGSSWHLGSRRLTRSLSAWQKAGVRLALSMDMVGVGSTLHVRGLEAAPNRSGRRLLAAAQRLGIRVTYMRDTGQSDHDDLTRGGVPAAWVEWRWDTCWHRPCDQISRVRRWKLWRAGKLVLGAARAAVD